MARVFLSHAGADVEATATVHGWLVEGGHEVFLDHHPEHGIAPGDPWQERLHERLRWADVVVCVETAAYCRSVWCTAEVVLAQSRATRLVPIRMQAGAAHPLLDSVQRLDATVDERGARDRLADLLARIDLGAGGAWPAGRSPYPGLRPFDVDWQRAFFGRESEVAVLAAMLRSPAERAEAAVRLLVGPSGCGKSSLVRAGLVPVMAADDEYRCLAPFVPGADPVGALATELVVAARALRLPEPVVSAIRDRVRQGRLGEVVDDLLTAGPGERRGRLLVVVDQFEEIVTVAAPATRAEFCRVLAPLLAGPVQVVGTVRPEFVDALQAAPELAGLELRLHLIAPLRPAQLAAVIEKPAELAGLQIDDGLVETIVADTGTGEALPLLAFTLAELADGAVDRLTAARYEELGGVHGALAARADDAAQAAARLTGRSEAVVVRDLLRLVVVDAQGRPTRRRVRRAELPADVVTEYGAFVDRRLLVTDSDGGHPVVGIAHEAFLTAWPPLATAIGAAVTSLRTSGLVEQAADRWTEQGGRPEDLWEGRQLVGAVADVGARLPTGRALTTERVELSERARTFLRSSMVRARRRRLWTAAGLSVLLLAVLSGVGVAVWQGSQATQQRQVAAARQLLALADGARGSDPRAALRLALAAEQIDPGPQARANLVDTLSHTRYARTLPQESEIVSVAVAPAGSLLAAGDVRGGVTLWDIADPAAPRRVGPPLQAQAGFVYSVAFSPDSRTLAVGGQDGTVTLWDVTAPAAPVRLAEPLAGHRAEVHGVAFSPDGRTLASVGFDGTLILRDVSDPRRAGTRAEVPTGHAGNVTTVAFAPDGRTLASAGFDGTIRLWDVADPARPALLGGPLTGGNNAIWAVAFAPRGAPRLASVDADGMLGLWDVAAPAAATRIGVPFQAHLGQAYSVAFAPDAATVATAGADRTTGLWSLADPAHPAPAGGRMAGHTDKVYSVAFTPDGRTLASAGADRTAVLWDVGATRGPVALGPPSAGDATSVYAAALAPSGRLLATGGEGGAVTLWDTTDPARPRPRGGLPATASAVRALAFSPDGAVLAAGAADGTLTSYDVRDADGAASPRRLGAAAGRDPIYALAYAPDGRRVAVASLRSVALWDVADPARPTPLGTAATDHQGEVYSVAFAPDGRSLVSAGAEGAVLLWAVGRPGAPDAGPRLSATLLTGGASPMYTVAFSPDGRLIAAAGYEGTVLLWEVPGEGTGGAAVPRRVGQPLEVGGPVHSLAFAADSGLLVAGGAAGQLRTWDVSQVGSPRALGEPVPAGIGPLNVVTIGPSWLAVGGGDGRLGLWSLTTLDDIRNHPVERACATVGTGLTSAEWSALGTGLSYPDTCPPP